MTRLTDKWFNVKTIPPYQSMGLAESSPTVSVARLALVRHFSSSQSILLAASVCGYFTST
jgi:hypothetical protein